MTTHKNPGQNEIFASTVRLLMYPRARGECYVYICMYGGEPPLCMFHSLAKRPYANWPVLTSSVQLVFIIIIMCTSPYNLCMYVTYTLWCLLPSTCVCRTQEFSVPRYFLFWANLLLIQFHWAKHLQSFLKRCFQIKWHQICFIYPETPYTIVCVHTYLYSIQI